MTRRNTILAIVLLFVAIVYFVYYQSGYSLSEERALQRSDYGGMTQSHKQSYGEDEVVILSNGSRSKVQVVHRKWGFLYKPGTSVEMAPIEGHPSVRYAWFSMDSASPNGKRLLVFAAESFEPSVKKVIISNDTLSRPANAKDVNGNASVYVELNVAQQYGIMRQTVDVEEIGSFVVRAADADGRIEAGTR
ncbi:hypothetical protein [Paenibacillus sacheonensis]|uniref:Uncharacterized protein n=1 Tax=Paenibacillus sacheonensis TaxID=742054 RepID=A0A7X5BYY2_9BACL|nr:hypothetical protein [Paenibacillus sacheonensis]MBM7565090.1 hypothetical protein [Paenibacillus sacheonensis]NBC70127.1 hypothetical protein [Paenibacillus sacheonensis]